MRSNILTLLIALMTATLLGAALTAQERYWFNGIPYIFPASQGASDATLFNTGSGTLSWTLAVPAGLLAFTTGTCPSGWAEYTPARGRYLVGLPVGGTNGGTVGTALTPVENRPAGVHSHTGSSLVVSVSDPGHNHGGTLVEGSGHRHGNAVLSNGTADPGSVQFLYRFSGTTSSATTGITIAAASSGITLQTTTPTTVLDDTEYVAGTNAPYIQYRLCERL
jgi:hypothetical protein